MRHASLRQKSTALAVFLKLCQDPQMLVDIYINYDCDRASIENIYERLVNVIAKIGQIPPGTYGKSDDLTEAGKNQSQPLLAGFSTGTSSDYNRIIQKYAGLSGEARLKRQSLECVVGTLKSLVAWVQANKIPERDEVYTNGEPPATPRRSEHRMSMTSSMNVSTPDITQEDDPEKLESARQRKVSMLEGIKMFNFKPKKVSSAARRCLDADIL
jgi:brefeldin A-inhibited guanine nucleotide-exchange protein